MKLEAAGLLMRSRVRQRPGHRLTPAMVKRTRQPGKYADGNGLWLVVDAPDRRYWHYRYQWLGRQRSISFGSTDRVSLAQARVLHAQARLMVERGIDPLERRRAAMEMLQAPSEATAHETFSFAAEEYLAAHEAAWKHPKHRQQWRSTLAATYPLIGDMILSHDVV